MIVVTEPAPQVRRTSASLALVQPKTLLDVARQATVRVANADAEADSVISAVEGPTTDVALSIERALLERLADTFSISPRVTNVEDPQRAFPFTPEGAQVLSGQIRSAGLGGYVLDVRTNFLDLETTGGTISDPVERFSLKGQVAVRLIDVSDGRVIRQAVCTDSQPMGTLRDIFVAEGKPVPERVQIETAEAEPEAETADAAETDEPRSAEDVSPEALALIESTDGSQIAPTPAESEAAEASEAQQQADAEAESIAQEAASAVTQPAAPVEPLGQPTQEDRVQDALRQAPAASSEVAEQEAKQSTDPLAGERGGRVPLRRTGMFSDVVQEAFSESSTNPLIEPSQDVTVRTEGVKQKARLQLAALAAAQATAPVEVPEPAAPGLVSDAAAERLIRKCTAELWQNIAP